MTELELIRRAKAGDRPAMTELVSAHFAQVHRLALHILRNEPDAEDATQNTFVKAFANLQRFDEQRSFKPWLLRIATRESLMIQRAERTRFAFWQRSVRDERSEETTESIVQVREERRELWRAVNQLKTKDRLVLTLSYFMGMSEADMAVTLDIKPGTVKSRKHNALLRLRAVVEQQFTWLSTGAAEEPESKAVSR